jgi:hypothetical protein
MVIIEIPLNRNCEPVDMRIFNDVEEPREVRRLVVAPPGREPAWYDVTGWTAEGGPCPALARRVDDSGEGLAVLVYGGSAGLRFRPAGSARPWTLDDPEQWGLPFLLTDEVPHG